MNNFLKTMVICITLILPSTLFADDCVVTTGSDGDGEGTFRYAAVKCNETITFTVNTVTVNEKIKLLKTGLTIDGKGDVTIKSTNFDTPLFEILTPNITIQNLSIKHGGPICIRTSKSGYYEGITFDGCETGIEIMLPSAISTTVTKSRFTDVSTPISITNKQGSTIPSAENLSAEWMNDVKWEMSGDWSNEPLFDITSVEVYKVDGNSIEYFTTIDADGDDFDATTSTFSMDTSWITLPPAYDYMILFTDKIKSSSELSEVVSPRSLLEDQLPQELEACASADWFWLDGLYGNSDDDGFTNDEEDKNLNCIVDEWETSPALSDTDDDGKFDDEDNCPLDKNSDQADSNDNGIGDACDETISPKQPGGDDGNNNDSKGGNDSGEGGDGSKEDGDDENGEGSGSVSGRDHFDASDGGGCSLKAFEGSNKGMTASVGYFIALLTTALIFRFRKRIY